ncbi:MAG TPA: TMEM165/GDT1 family protein [Sphingomonas sp.]|nr:TMEM165/GDT1 family protein [Sphingomonas sp.]
MAALVAAALAQATDRSAVLAARLGDRFARPGAALAGLALALVVVNAIAAAGAVLVAPILTPNAKALLLALALLSAGGAALFKPKPPKGEARGGAFVAGLAGGLALGLGDRAQFITFALAARTPIPELAAAGAVLGGLAAIVPSLLLGERGRARLPEPAIRLTIAAVLIVAGAVAGLSALRLL